MATAADWIEATFGTALSTTGIVGDYWSAEQYFNGGADVGLSATQLFTYWHDSGIAGTTLTGASPVSLGNVKGSLSNHYVLIAAENLPAGFPTGEGQGGNHMWLVVGYSSHGPMLVSWGQEVQISLGGVRQLDDGRLGCRGDAGIAV